MLEVSLLKEPSVRKPVPEKFILDATAGFRMMWFNKHHPNCIYLDQRPECEPDIVGDFRDLKQFPNETFKLIVFDPPHKLSNNISDPNARFNKDFGWLETETWQYDLKKGLGECWRVLRKEGILILKWNTKRIKVERLYPLFPTTPLFGQIAKGDKGWGKKGASQTLWFCFMKIENEKTGADSEC